MALSQFHPLSWSCVRFYLYWCEYLKRNYRVFSSLSPTLWYYAKPRGRELVFLVLTIWVFEDLPELTSFVEWFFLVTPLHSLAHAIVYGVRLEVEGKCKPLFSHFWSEKHFLIENDTYVYKEEDFSDKDSYQKNILVGFVNNLVILGMESLRSRLIRSS